MDEKNRRKEYFRKFKNVLLIFLLLLVIGVPSFAYFKVTTDGRFALREAKNVNMAFQMLSIEYYGKDLSIYNPYSSNGLNTGVSERLKDVTENRGEVRLLSYDTATRKVHKFTYETGNVRVTYSLKEDDTNEWKVDYLWNIWTYDGDK